MFGPYCNELRLGSHLAADEINHHECAIADREAPNAGADCEDRSRNVTAGDEGRDDAGPGSVRSTSCVHGVHAGGPDAKKDVIPFDCRRRPIAESQDARGSECLSDHREHRLSGDASTSEVRRNGGWPHRSGADRHRLFRLADRGCRPLADPAEERAHIIQKVLGPLHGGEVAAFRELRPALDVVLGLAPRPGRRPDLFGEDRDPNRWLDSH
jgi:hypothetical protein